MVCVSGGGFLLVGNTVRFSKVGPGIRGSVLKSSCKLGGVGLVTEGWARSVAQRVFFLDGYQVRKERGSFLRANAALGAPSANWDPSARCPVMRTRPWTTRSPLLSQPTSPLPSPLPTRPPALGSFISAVWFQSHLGETEICSPRLCEPGGYTDLPSPRNE